MMTNALNQRVAYLQTPDRIKRLKVSSEGYPVPWFVAWIKGQPDFRAFDGDKLAQAVKFKKCWMCGEPLGKFYCFPIGPMCCVNRNISEPPSHYECAAYAVRACPFLSMPKMRRNEKDAPEGHVAGFSIDRNPGVVALWVTKQYRVYRAPNGGALFELGDPERVEYYAEGRRATRAEILASMESGLPLLMEVAEREGSDAVEALQGQYNRALELLPP